MGVLCTKKPSHLAHLLPGSYRRFDLHQPRRRAARYYLFYLQNLPEYWGDGCLYGMNWYTPGPWHLKSSSTCSGPHYCYSCARPGRIVVLSLVIAGSSLLVRVMRDVPRNLLIPRCDGFALGGLRGMLATGRVRLVRLAAAAQRLPSTTALFSHAHRWSSLS